MGNADQNPQMFKIEEAFIELIFSESDREVFSGRKEYEDSAFKFFSPDSLHQKINSEFDQIYEFEKAVLDFFEFFKKNQTPESESRESAS